MFGANIIGFGLRPEEFIQASNVEKAALERRRTHKLAFVGCVIRRLKVLLPDVIRKCESHADVDLQPATLEFGD